MGCVSYTSSIFYKNILTTTTFNEKLKTVMPFNFDRFYITLLGISFGAFPFLLLGVVVATCIQLYGKNEWFTKFTKLNPFISHISIALFGLFIPVCECGNIPIIKKLMARGFSISHAVTYLLAAPIVNPVTIFTTYQVFSDYPALIGFRILGGLLLAVIIGMSVILFKEPSRFLSPTLRSESEKSLSGSDHHHHVNKLEEFTSHFTSEFIYTFKYLFIGSAIAAFVQTSIPREFFVQIGSNPLLSVLVMIAFAFIISVCSNVDAFIALSFSNVFSNASLLGFLVFGPMMDIKTITMLRGIFTPKFTTFLTTSIFAGTLVLVLGYYLINLIGIV
jgi:uncharacterized protein